MALKTTLEDTQDRLEALLTYANSVTGADDTSLGDAIETLANGYGSGGSSLPIQLELVGTWTGYLPEYTDTTAYEVIDTGIDIKNAQENYIYFLYTIECDGSYDEITTNYAWSGTAWGILGRYDRHYSPHPASNSEFYRVNKNNPKLRPRLTSDLQSGPQGFSDFLMLEGNGQNVRFRRKANSNYILMGGNYTVNVYAILFD